MPNSNIGNNIATLIAEKLNMDYIFDYSLIIPVYKNEENIHDLLVALCLLHKNINVHFEILFIVDGSPDKSYALLAEVLPSCPFRSQLVALSRNFGSFAAIRVGLEMANGKYCAAMAADLQEPPELVEAFLQILRNDEADVVFGVRSGRDDSHFSSICSLVFWSLYRKIAIRDMPKGGVDIFGCNRKVINSVLQIYEPNSSLISQLFWVGFRRKLVPYHRRMRKKGKSAWKFSSRFRYMLDSIFSYSDLPVMVLLWVGGIGLFFSSIIGAITLVGKVAGIINVPGYASIILLIVLLTSLMLFTQGIIASYLWRAFENTKKRPLSIVQHHEIFNENGTSVK